MSAASKRKYVFQEFDDMTLPADSQIIVQIVASRGHNLFEIVTPSEEQYLVSMPTKFRQNIFVKRGDFIVVEPIKEGKKVKGEIVKILTKVKFNRYCFVLVGVYIHSFLHACFQDHIKWYREQNCWPPEFNKDLKRNGDSIKTNHAICDDEELFVNTNRCHPNQQTNDTDDSDSDSSSSSSSSSSID